MVTANQYKTVGSDHLDNVPITIARVVVSIKLRELCEISRSNILEALSIPIIKTPNERTLFGRMVFQFYRTVPNTGRNNAKAQ